MLKHLWLALALCTFLANLALAQPDLSTIRAYKTDTPPTIDGTISPGEWDAAGPAIVISADEGDTAFPEDPFGGPSDLSYQFRAMWAEPWTAYFLFEITDDIAMEIIPQNRWEMDQVEFFMDGDDLEGSTDLPTYQWWDSTEPYGKFGASRFEAEFEGNAGAMSTFIEDLYTDGFGAYSVAMASETGTNGNYLVEYAVTLEPMFDLGTFDGTATADAEQIVEGVTTVKWTACVSDDDNYGDGTAGRSHALCVYRNPEDADWRNTEAFADLLFAGAFTGGTAGDFNGDGLLDAADIDLLTGAVGGGDLSFDVDGDGSVTADDRQVWIRDLKGTWVGDSDLNGEFNSADFVAVFQAGKFETGAAASWGEGDWDGNGVFGSGDFVAAFQDGGFEQGPRAAVASVPEPAGAALLLVGLTLIGLRRRNERR